MYWATVLYFNRSVVAENLFDMMGMIQNNYGHYSHLYGFRPVPYRNDYSLSIALNTVYGHVIPQQIEIPWPLMNVEFATDIKLNDDSAELKFTRRVENQIKNFRITTINQDLHVLNKSGLMENI
jgi:hypothetical protein